VNDFTDKVALITGAGQGIGRDVALAFSSMGAAVAANDINPIGLAATVNAIQHVSGIGIGLVFDVAKRMPVEAMLSQALEHFGHIDFLVNQAFVAPDVSILDMDEWEYHRTMDVNLGGPFLCIQQVGRIMRQQGGGAIVNIASLYRKPQAIKGDAVYYASQVGLIGLTRATARELSAYNIRVNAVCHGMLVSDLASPPELALTAYHKWRESLPALPGDEHTDLVNLVLFLCSPAASSLTGQVISIPTKST